MTFRRSPVREAAGVPRLGPNDIVIDCQRPRLGTSRVTVTIYLPRAVPPGFILDLEWHRAQDHHRVRQVYRPIGSSRMTFSVIMEPGRYYLSVGLFTADWSRCLIWLDAVQHLSVPASEADVGQENWAAAARTSYQRFLGHYVDRVSDRAWRIMRPEEGRDTVSEGMAYGMLLALAHNDLRTFHKLWSYAQSYLNRHELMAWRIHARGTVMDAGSAADADQDMAYALIQAGLRWSNPSYLDAGTRMVRAIRQWETDDGYLRPGDAWAPTPRIFNPSYVCLHYYPVFGRATRDPWWNEWAETSLGILKNAQHPVSGLWPDWLALDEGQGGTLPPGFDSTFSYDAVRVPWRLYLAARAGMARELNPLGEKMVPFFVARGLNGLCNVYTVSGEPLSSQVSGAFVAMSALTRYAFTVDSRTQEFLTYVRDWIPESYYDAAIQALVLASVTGSLTFI